MSSRLLYALLLSALVCGCAALQPRVDPVEGVVAEAVRLSTAPAAEQRDALEASRLAVERARAGADAEALEVALVRRAVLLGTLPGGSPGAGRIGAIAQAIGLLEPLARSGSDRPLGRFAALYLSSLREREQLAAALRASQERAGSADERSRLANERANAANERVNLLRQQLDALKSAERGILEREEKMRAQKR
jgi:hypothetical protein